MTVQENEGAPDAGTSRGAESRSDKGRPLKSTAAPRPPRDFRAVAEAARRASEAVLMRWLPGGKLRGREYGARNPRRDDSRPGSFSVNVETGRWSDFATGDKGGDLVSLVAYLDGVEQAEACDRLSSFLGLDAFSTAPVALSTKRAAEPSKPAAECVAPIPEAAPPPPKAHPRHGRPSIAWTYRDAEGRELGQVWRFDRAEGGKEVMPLTLWREGERLSWRFRAPPEPRPLFGLERIAAHPAAPVLVVEGEKAADAAARLLPACAVVTSPSGSRSASKADWSPMRGRRVLIWPDADEPGDAYAADVARLALGAGAASVGLLKRARLTALRGADLPEAWDAADCEAEGLDAAALAALLADPGAWESLQVPKNDDEHRAGASNRSGTFPLPGGKGSDRAGGQRGRGSRSPFLHVEPGDPEGRRPGVYYLPTMRDRESGQWVEGAPEWVCSPLRVEAATRDYDGGDWGRLLVFPDRDGTEHRWAMPQALLAKDGAELREVLLSQGLEITSDPNARRRLVEYIQGAEPGRFARCVARAGWHGDVFVLPSEAVGAAGGEALVFQSAAPGDHKLGASSTLAQWRDGVARLCIGNSRLVLSVAAGFAAPCLHLAGQEGGGLHLRGASSCGKSTALALAASVYGPPEYRREWRATDNALESVAALHCDALLVIDEIGQLEPKHAAGSAYLLGNGQGKSRSRRDGSLRAPATWRLLFLSCGEVGLCDLIAEAGGKARAGMEVLVVDLPADAGAGMGLFEHVPEGFSAGAFADALKAATKVHYGTAFPAFLRALVADIDKARRVLRAGVERLGAELAGDDVAGQVRRVAARFALIATAGELATVYGLTGWPAGEAERAARACFAAWLGARGGSGESEPREMVRQVQAFIGLHSEGRFAPLSRSDDDRAPKTLLRAGWRTEDTHGDGVEHWVLPEVWKREVCGGFDAIEVARMLAERGLLKPEGKGFTRRERVKGQGLVRVYRLLPGILECEP